MIPNWLKCIQCKPNWGHTHTYKHTDRERARAREREVSFSVHWTIYSTAIQSKQAVGQTYPVCARVNEKKCSIHLCFSENKIPQCDYSGRTKQTAKSNFSYSGLSRLDCNWQRDREEINKLITFWLHWQSITTFLSEWMSDNGGECPSSDLFGSGADKQTCAKQTIRTIRTVLLEIAKPIVGRFTVRRHDVVSELGDFELLCLRVRVPCMCVCVSPEGSRGQIKKPG